jgi:rubrerythrin
MSMLFTAGEVFEIAIEIERNGAGFYRKAAAATADASARHELLELAAMEDSHELTFTELKRDLVGDEPVIEWFDADSEAAIYLRNFAAGQIFDMTKGMEVLPGTPLPEVLQFALQRERDSVVFFLGLKEMMPVDDKRSLVDTIIKQEMGHIALLGRRLLEASGRA